MTFPAAIRNGVYFGQSFSQSVCLVLLHGLHCERPR